MAGLTITVGGNDITAYVDVRSIVVEEIGGAMIATCQFKARDHTGTVSIAAKDVIDIDDDGTALFAGEVATVTKSQDGVSKIWDVRGQDYNILLAETVIEEETYAATVADSYILGNATYGLFPQHRNDIDASTYVSTIDASMEAVSFVAMTLQECLDDLARRTGARYYVDFDKNLHWFDTEDNDASFSLSTSPDFESSFPFGDFRKVEEVTQLANKVFVSGKEVSGWTQDADSIDTYGERHAVSRDMRITTDQGVTDRGNAILDRYDLPRETYELWTEKDGLRAGQSVTVVNATWSINSAFYIRKLRMEILSSDGDKRRYHLELNDESPDLVRETRQQNLVINTGETVATDVINTIFDTDAPSAPTLTGGNLSTGVDVDADGHQIVYLQVTWGVVSDSDLDHYQLQIATSNDFSGYTVTREHPAGGDRVERFIGLLGSTTYYVRVRAVDWVGNNSDWSDTQNTATSADTTPPAQVANLSVGSSRTLMGLQWDANSEADLKHYEIQRAEDSEGSPGEYSTIAIAALNFYIDQDFTNEQIAAEDTFWYRVRAVDTSGNKGDWATAVDATLGQISGDHLAANCITANHIAATTITAEKMNVTKAEAKIKEARNLFEFDGKYAAARLAAAKARATAQPGISLGPQTIHVWSMI